MSAVDGAKPGVVASKDSSKLSCQAGAPTSQFLTFSVSQEALFGVPKEWELPELDWRYSFTILKVTEGVLASFLDLLEGLRDPKTSPNPFSPHLFDLGKCKLDMEKNGSCPVSTYIPCHLPLRLQAITVSLRSAPLRRAALCVGQRHLRRPASRRHAGGQSQPRAQEVEDRLKGGLDGGSPISKGLRGSYEALASWHVALRNSGRRLEQAWPLPI